MSQLEFFNDQPVEPVAPIDTDAIADHIAANARQGEYVDRTSDAARDQGHGPIAKTVEDLSIESVSAAREQVREITESLRTRSSGTTLFPKGRTLEQAEADRDASFRPRI